ncbi:YceD family protein [Diaphorobacter ruginosibacter]|jgi:Predicted metal-binding, possibly nucleic acid-binding protein|uniref:YceD family protein n=1 Tax=Diaphorobacter ruginosibacter TaxID=1715720 RepID=UPI0033411932
MTKEHSPDRLDIKAFAQAGVHLSGHDSLLKYKRVAQEAKGLHPDLHVDWQAHGEVRTVAGLGAQVWLHLTVHAAVPMQCQRCLGPVDVPIDIDREFRFVADEATAEALDDECEEDLLVLSREFDLRELIEDELLLELPAVPRHDECPSHVVMKSSDDDFEEANAQKTNPFAALASLRVDGKKN